MMVKVCGITRREDAKAVAEAGATAIGFIFYAKSPRVVAPAAAVEIGAGLPLWKVGVFVDESPAAIEAMMRAAQLDIVQIYKGQVNGGQSPPGARVWRAFRLDNASRASYDAIHAGGAEAVLLDGASNGISFDWRIARQFAEASGVRDTDAKLIVAGGLDASNVGEAIRVAKPWGVDASSKLETAPGIKDRDKVRAFVHAALEAGGAV